MTGTLPAQYGLRTAGVLDITSRAFAAPGGDVSLYGGSRQTFTPSFDYGGSVGKTEYFVTAAAIGTPRAWKIRRRARRHPRPHRAGQVLRLCLDAARRIDAAERDLGGVLQRVPDTEQSQSDAAGRFRRRKLLIATLNENEYDTYCRQHRGVAEAGHRRRRAALSVFALAEVHFVPDIFGDLVFNDVASNVIRESLLTGTQFDTSYIVNDRHTMRAGFAVSGEQTNVTNASTVLPVDPVSGNPADPVNHHRQNSLLGWNIGTYIQDEWKITNQLT